MTKKNSFAGVIIAVTFVVLLYFLFSGMNFDFSSDIENESIETPFIGQGNDVKITNIGDEEKTKFVFSEKNYSKIEDFDIRDMEGTLILSIKTKSDLPKSDIDFENSNVVSFGYAWLRPNNEDGSFAGVFTNVHTVDGVIGPLHSELVRLDPLDVSFCVLSWPIINEVSAGDGLIRELLSSDELDFSYHDIDTAASIVILQNLSCDSGFEAKIVNTLKRG